MLKEILGESYKDGMTFEDVEEALKNRNIVDVGKVIELRNEKRTLENKVSEITKQFDEFKRQNMTDAEKAKQDAENFNKVMEENRRFKLKDELYENGFSNDEVKRLMETDLSPKTFAEIATARAEQAVKRNTAKGIKDTTKEPSADKSDSENGLKGGMTKEQYEKLSYSERLELYNTDRETYDKFN